MEKGDVKNDLCLFDLIKYATKKDFMVIFQQEHGHPESIRADVICFKGGTKLTASQVIAPDPKSYFSENDLACLRVKEALIQVEEGFKKT